MITTFFYGLFMEEAFLRGKGLHPQKFRLAHVNDFALLLGERATIVVSPGERVYGSVMDLSEEALEVLYGENGLAGYVPQQLEAVAADGKLVNATCYVLAQPVRSAPNAEYAANLAALATRMGLPADYVGGIRRQAALER